MIGILVAVGKFVLSAKFVGGLVVGALIGWTALKKFATDVAKKL